MAALLLVLQFAILIFITVVWDVALCSLVGANISEECVASSLHVELLFLRDFLRQNGYNGQ
jgi:hypothetical protein